MSYKEILKLAIVFERKLKKLSESYGEQKIPMTTPLEQSKIPLLLTHKDLSGNIEETHYLSSTNPYHKIIARCDKCGHRHPNFKHLSKEEILSFLKELDPEVFEEIKKEHF
jgi:hypothetical protein